MLHTHRAPQINWPEIDKVFLDMDGTLLDKFFDDYFWETFVPEQYAKKYGIEKREAKNILLNTYNQVAGTLQWTDLDYWSESLGLDMTELKRQVSNLVAIRPMVHQFFSFLQQRHLSIYLVTNAHPTVVDIKMEKVPLRDYFMEIVCSQDVGSAKEEYRFWPELQKLLPFDKERTLFVDDTEKVLDSANEYGIKHLLHIAKPSSKLPAKYSLRYPSIKHYNELLNGPHTPDKH